MHKKEVFGILRLAILNYDVEMAKKAAKGVIEEGLDALKAIEITRKAMIELGIKFAKLEIFLPELMLAADAMDSILTILKPKLLTSTKKIPELGTVVIGVVRGDIHDIGKNMVSTLLTATGFKVIDLGVDVPFRTFAEALETYEPDIVAASAAMTSTMFVQRDLVEYLEGIGVRDRVKIMVGGAPVRKEWAKEIGVDGYGENAAEAAEAAKRIVTKKKEGGL